MQTTAQYHERRIAVRDRARALLDAAREVQHGDAIHNAHAVISETTIALSPLSGYNRPVYEHEAILTRYETEVAAAATRVAEVLDLAYSAGTRYYVVRCDTCLVLANSGHHYRRRADAEREAARHDAEHHAVAPSALDLCNACDEASAHRGCEAGYCAGCCPVHG